MTVYLGSREIRLLLLGRGHTAGDVVVYLPQERVVATGDLLVENTSYMGDAFFTEWIDTIETLKKLDFDTVLPGHGQAFTGKAKLDHWQAYLGTSGRRRRSSTRPACRGRKRPSRWTCAATPSTTRPSGRRASRRITPCAAPTRSSTDV